MQHRALIRRMVAGLFLLVGVGCVTVPVAAVPGDTGLQGDAEGDVSGTVDRHRIEYWGEGDAVMATPPSTGDDGPATAFPEWLVLSGHRGAGADDAVSLAPENTLMAFETARAVGVNAVEFDVRVTADDEFVVIHDASTGRTTPEDIPVESSLAEDIVGLRADADYTDIGAPYSVPEADAVEATVPSLEEALDYLQETDMIARIELKGRVRTTEDLGAEVYRMVRDRGMTDRAVFMQWPGPCRNPLWGSRDCRWSGIEGVEDASEGEARTAALWRKRGGILDKDVHIDDTIRYADGNGFDIVYPRVDDPQMLWYNNGLEGTDWSVDDFVEEIDSRGMGYAFMSFDGSLEEELAYAPEWISANRIDLLMEDIQEIDLDQYRDRYEQ